MNNFNSMYKKHIGYKGEIFVIDKLKTKGFMLFKRNIKFSDTEIDFVVYRFNYIKKCLEIRVVEVKTRAKIYFNLNEFGLKKKWLSVARYIFKIKDSILISFPEYNNVYCEVHYDLAVVLYVKMGNTEIFEIVDYIKDINLML